MSSKSPAATKSSLHLAHSSILATGTSGHRRAQQRGIALSNALIVTTAFAIGILLVAKVTARIRSDDDTSSVSRALGLEPSISELRQSRCKIWAGASPDEESTSIILRAREFCGGLAQNEELIELIACHPRYRADPGYAERKRSAMRSEGTLHFYPGYYLPLCILFRQEANQPETR